MIHTSNVNKTSFCIKAVRKSCHLLYISFLHSSMLQLVLHFKTSYFIRQVVPQNISLLRWETFRNGTLLLGHVYNLTMNYCHFIKDLLGIRIGNRLVNHGTIRDNQSIMQVAKQLGYKMNMCQVKPGHQ